MTPARPTTARVLNKFEPRTLPRAISASPFLAAITEDANSGRDVPTATTVNPIMISDTPKLVAIPTAP